MAHSTPLDAELPELGDGEPSFSSPMPLPLTAELSVLPEPAMLTVPPERVRFTVPLTVEVPGGEEASGAIVNLSPTGLACILPLALHDGERVGCRFRPALGDEELEIQAEVVWRRRTAGTESVYGLRLVDVPAAERQRIEAVVRERAEGRAGEWPLPVLPAVSRDGGRRASPWLTAALGMAAGAALSLGLSFLPSVVLGRVSPRPAEPVVAPPPAVAPSPAGAAGGGMQLEGDPAPAPSAAAAVADVDAGASSSAEPQSVATPAPIAGTGPEVAHEPSAAPAAVAASPAAVAASPAAPVADASRLEIVLAADRPVGEFKTFWLDGPRRLVVDIVGARSVSSAERPIVHALASRVRVGNHADRVRFVIETSDAAARKVEARARGNELVVTLSAR